MAGDCRVTLSSMLGRFLVWSTSLFSAPGSLLDANSKCRAGKSEDALGILEVLLLRGDYSANQTALGLTHGLRGDCLGQLAREEEARAAYFKALDCDPQCTCYWNLALLALQHRDAEAARRALAAIDLSYPDETTRTRMANHATIDLSALRELGGDAK